MIDVDAAAENAMVIFSAIEELRKDTEEGWKKLAVLLDQVIEANNVSGTWYFSNFLFLVFYDFPLALSPPHSFLSVSLIKKRQYACY